jgi:hypothetical protein
MWWITTGSPKVRGGTCTLKVKGRVNTVQHGRKVPTTMPKQRVPQWTAGRVA